MHCTSVKIIEAQQASVCYIYKNINPLNAEFNPICHLLAILGAHHILHVSKVRIKLKLLKINATIWFNKMCKIKHLKPNYINIKVNGEKSKDKIH